MFQISETAEDDVSEAVLGHDNDGGVLFYLPEEGAKVRDEDALLYGHDALCIDFPVSRKPLLALRLGGTGLWFDRPIEWAEDDAVPNGWVAFTPKAARVLLQMALTGDFIVPLAGTNLISLAQSDRGVEEDANGNALTAAVKDKDIVRVRSLLAAGFHPDSPSAFDDDLATPLCCAIADVQEVGDEIVFALLEAGANADGVPRSSSSPLEVAALYGECEIISVLVERGAQSDAGALDVAVRDNQRDAALRLCALGASKRPWPLGIKGKEIRSERKAIEEARMKRAM